MWVCLSPPLERNLPCPAAITPQGAPFPYCALEICRLISPNQLVRTRQHRPFKTAFLHKNKDLFLDITHHFHTDHLKFALHFSRKMGIIFSLSCWTLDTLNMPVHVQKNLFAVQVQMGPHFYQILVTLLCLSPPWNSLDKDAEGKEPNSFCQGMHRTPPCFLPQMVSKKKSRTNNICNTAIRLRPPQHPKQLSAIE